MWSNSAGMLLISAWLEITGLSFSCFGCPVSQACRNQPVCHSTGQTSWRALDFLISHVCVQRWTASDELISHKGQGSLAKRGQCSTRKGTNNRRHLSKRAVRGNGNEGSCNDGAVSNGGLLEGKGVREMQRRCFECYHQVIQLPRDSDVKKWWQASALSPCQADPGLPEGGGLLGQKDELCSAEIDSPAVSTEQNQFVLCVWTT